jgi:hypothetical protein
MTRLFPFRLLAGIVCLSLLGVSQYAAAAEKAPAGADEWRFGAEVYFWAPWIDIKTETGGDVEISLDDIINNLDMAFMADLMATRGKWSFGTDLIYFELESGKNTNLPLDLVLDNVDLEAWILTPQIRYAISETDRHKIDLVAGARYLWIEQQLKLKTQPPLPPATSKAHDSGSVWDGIVGVAGQTALSDKWYLRGYADIGTGDSDFTWQALAAFGYRFKHFDAAVGYRYLDYDLGSNDAIKDLSVHGPIVGARFMF